MARQVVFTKEESMFAALPPQNEIQKTQAVRGLDVWLVGPMMIMGGRCLGGTKGTLLKVLGFGTVIYNAMNHYEQAKQTRGL